MSKAHLKSVLPGAFLWLSLLLMVTGGFAVAEEPKGAGDKTEKASSLSTLLYYSDYFSFIGKDFQLSLCYEDRRQELIGALEPIEY